MSNEFTNRELETRDPNRLIVVTADMLKKHPEQRDVLAKYYDVRAERALDEGLKESIRSIGAVHTPLFITDVEGIGDVVISGRQRRKAAVAAGLKSVPVIVHSDDDKINVMLELSENLARSQNTPKESGQAYRKALQQGINQEQIAAMAGVTPASISNAISIADMPKVVHNWIEKGKLTPTAALQIKKACGKKSPKGSGVTAIYDEKEVETFLTALAEKAVEGGDLEGKVKISHAKNSKAGFVEGLTRKEWEALVADESTPIVYANLISVFLNKMSLTAAKMNVDGELEFLRKIVPQPKPKPVKEPKVKAPKAPKKGKEKAVTPAESSDEDLSSLFG